MPHFHPRAACATFALLAAGLLAGCTGLDVSRNIANAVTPYKLEILQGNFISKEQVAALRAGMTRQQARDLLGTPLVASLFHADRWDYVFVFKGQGGQAQSRKLVLFFSGNQLARFEGDEMPSEAQFVANLDSGRKLGKVPPLEATPEALGKFSTAPAAASTAVLKAAPAAAASYPPLEPAAR